MAYQLVTDINYSDVVDYLAQQLNCSTSRISCREYNPIDNPSYDSGFVFLGPNNTKIAEIRWRKSGRCVGLYEYPDNIEEENYASIQRAKEAANHKIKSMVHYNLQKKDFLLFWA